MRTRDAGHGMMWTMPQYGKYGKPLAWEVYHTYHTSWKTLAWDRVYHIDHITATRFSVDGTAEKDGDAVCLYL